MNEGEHPRLDIDEGVVKPTGITALIEESIIQHQLMADDEPRISAFGEALSQLLSTHHKGRQAIDRVLEIRNRPEFGGPIKAPFVFNSLLRFFQMKFLEAYPDYPAAFDSPDRWFEGMSTYMDDPKSRDDFISHMHVFRNVNSNVSERYKAFKMLSLMKRDQLGDWPRILDVGCSQNLGLKRMAKTHAYPFEAIEVVGLDLSPDFEPEEQAENEDTQLRREQYLTDAANYLLSQLTQIGPSTGVDLWPTRDPELAKWAKACSFYPSELLDEELVRSYEAIEAEDAAALNIDFVEADFTWPAEKLDKLIPPEHQFDMVTFSTVMYQMRDREQRFKAVQNALKRVKPEGLVVIQDFLEMDPKGHISFPARWSDRLFLYTTAVLDMANPDLDFQETFLWRNGRCGQLMLGVGRMAIGERIFSIGDALNLACEDKAA